LISALKARELDTAAKESQLGVSTVNEIRNSIGRDAIDGGDVIYAPSTTQPILGEDAEDAQSDDQSTDNDDEDQDQDQSEDENQDDEKSLFIQRMKSHGYTDEKIEELWRGLK
jgi:hypothetical protein